MMSENSYLSMLCAGGLACVSTLLLVPVMIKIATKLQFIDMPDGQVKQHKQPTPYLGGVAVFLGFLLGSRACIPALFEQYTIVTLILGACLLLIIGLIDDFYAMSPAGKFAGQVGVVAFLMASGFSSSGILSFMGLNNESTLFIAVISQAISFLWMATLINAFNLIDIKDGLATTTAFCGALSLAGIAIFYGEPVAAATVVPLLGAFCGGLLGFLWFNKPVARIYLGDAGSLFIGGFLSAIVFLFDWNRYSSYGYLVPCAIFAIPLLEVASLIVIRTYKGIPFYRPSPDHFAIYLQQNGWSLYSILCYVVCFSVALTGLASLMVMQMLQPREAVVAFAGLLALWLFFLNFPLNKKKSL